MARRLLLGPVSASFSRLWFTEADNVRTFGYDNQADITVHFDDSWEEVCARLPQGWRPEAILLHLPHSSVPGCFWSAPVPLIGCADECDLAWPFYRHALPLCDLVLTEGSVGWAGPDTQALDLPFAAVPE